MGVAGYRWIYDGTEIMWAALASVAGSAAAKAIGGGGSAPSYATGAAYGAPNYINVAAPSGLDYKKLAIGAAVGLLVYAVWKKQR